MKKGTNSVQAIKFLLSISYDAVRALIVYSSVRSAGNYSKRSGMAGTGNGVMNAGRKK